MEPALFSPDSIWTMLHGIVFGGGVLMALAAALFYLRAVPAADAPHDSPWFGRLTVAIAVMLWVTVIVGTYVIFPPYRATPPEGLTDLAQYPRSLLTSNPATAWLHGFAMEIKEHVPWIVAMLATAVAFIAVRYKSQVLRDATLRRLTTTLLAICLLLGSVAGVLGIFINKVAPLD